MIFTATWKQNSGFIRDGNLFSHVVSQRCRYLWGGGLVGKVRGHTQTGAGAKERDDISRRTLDSFTADLSSAPRSGSSPSLCLACAAKSRGALSGRRARRCHTLTEPARLPGSGTGRDGDGAGL